MVSAKRKLDGQVGVDSSEKVSPAGEGVLNQLFAAKNSPGDVTARKSFDAISEAFKGITGGWGFDVFINSGNMIQLKFSRAGGQWIDAENCGLGFRDILIMLYFIIAYDADVILIEEPENHQHPDIQKKLAGFLRKQAQRQFFLSTHSGVFSNMLYADRVFSCKITDQVLVENVTSRASVLSSLGYSVSDNLISDLVILVEGPSDNAILTEFLHKMGLMSQYTIRIWPLGGDIMSQLDLSVFSDTYKVRALIDTDPESRKVREAFKAKCAKLGVPVHQLKRYSIENYLSLPVIERVMHQNAPEGVKSLKADTRVSDQLGFDVKRNAGLIAREMTLDDVKGSDLGDFLDSVKQVLIGG